MNFSTEYNLVMQSKVVSQGSENPRSVAGLGARRSITSALFFAILLPIIAGAAILFKQALTVPFQDDYDAVIAYATDYNQLSALKAKVLFIAAAQHNEYKLVFEHSIVALEMEFTHHLNFAFLVVLGNLFLLPIGYLLWRMSEEDESRRDLDQRLLKFLPVSLLFFGLSYWENLNWAMTGLQNTPVILFSLLAIYFLASRKMPLTRSRLVVACLAAAFAAFTSANGFFLGPIGLWILLERRAFGKALAWCGSFVLPFVAYRYHYVSSEIVKLVHYRITRPLFFLSFLGCVIPFRWPAVLLGLAVLAIVALAVRSHFDRTNPVAFYFMVWILITGSLAAWVRGALGFTTASRYSIYSCLSLIFCYLFLAQYLPGRFRSFDRRRFSIGSVVIAAAICIGADVAAYKNLQERRRMVLAGIELYRANPEINSPMTNPEVERAFKKEKGFEQVTLTRAIKDGVYTLPPQQAIP
jgi:hypothetical protein